MVHKVKIENLLLGTLIFSGTEHFLPGTQAFTSPPDMASFGVYGKILFFARHPLLMVYVENIFTYNFNLIIAKGLFLSNYVNRW